MYVAEKLFVYQALHWYWDLPFRSLFQDCHANAVQKHGHRVTLHDSLRAQDDAWDPVTQNPDENLREMPITVEGKSCILWPHVRRHP